MLNLERLVRFAPDDAGGEVGTNDGAQTSEAPQTWDAFLETLPPETRALYEQNISGLRNTVQATRSERDALKARVDALVAALDGKEPAAVKQQLTELQSELATANQRALFYEEAGRPEIGCRNPKLAFLVAQAESLFDRRGQPDWEAIRKTAPELFGSAMPRGNAGTGTGSPPPARQSINDYIRQQAGR
jgi:hypothetical protein